jgi:hypothetical protein
MSRWVKIGVGGRIGVGVPPESKLARAERNCNNIFCIFIFGYMAEVKNFS